MGVITRIASQDVNNTASANTVSATYPATPAQGNLLIASVAGNLTPASITVSDTNGNWTTVNSTLNQAAGTFFVSLAYKIADPSQPTVITASDTPSTQMFINIYEYTGNAKVSVPDQSNTSQMAATGTTSGGGSITTLFASELLFTNMFGNGTMSALSVDSSFSMRQQNATGLIRLADADRIVTATGTYNPKFSWTTSRTNGQVVASFRASTASGMFTLMGVG